MIPEDIAAISSLVTFAASSSVLPMIISVRIELDAIALPQPKVWNLASAMRPSSSSRKLRRRASPHAMEPTSPTPSGFSTAPTLRGFMKWSMTFSE